MARLALSIVGAGVGFLVGGPAGARIGFTAGSIIGGLFEGSRRAPTQRINIPGPQLPDAQQQTSRDGVPIPIVWGLSHCSGNLIQTGPMVEVTTSTTTTQGGGGRRGKGGRGGGGGTVETTTTSTRRFRTFAIGIARSSEGPLRGVLRIWEYDKLVYDARPVPAIPIADTEAFGAGIRIHLGTHDQLPDPDLEALSGVGQTPAYRGLAYIVFLQKDITDFGSMIPQYRFEVEAGGTSFLTSHPYPVEVIEGVTANAAITGGMLIGALAEESVEIVSMDVIEGELKTLLEDYDHEEPEAVEILSMDVIEGELKVALLDYDHEAPESVEIVSMDVITGELKLGLIEYTDPDNPSVAGSADITDGSLT